MVLLKWSVLQGQGGLSPVALLSVRSFISKVCAEGAEWDDTLHSACILRVPCHRFSLDGPRPSLSWQTKSKIICGEGAFIQYFKVCSESMYRVLHREKKLP